MWGDQSRPGGQAFWGRASAGKGGVDIRCLLGLREVLSEIWDEPEGRTRLSDFTFTFHFHALEKEMETHSRVLAWRIPGTGEPGGLPSMGSHRVGHD